MLKTHQNTITESIMFLEQPRPHFLPSSRLPRINIAKKRQHHSVYIYVYISIYLYIYIYLYILHGQYIRKKAKTQRLPTSFAHEELYIILLYNLL